MMYFLFLTIFLCLSNADVFINVGDQSSEQISYKDEPHYNIHQWVKELQLETCALVAIGLKYFAIFVEKISESTNTTLRSSKFFLGICHQSTLEKWHFCSPNLTRKRKHKCKFKLKGSKYQPRVHRRFCDIKIMVDNVDCICQPIASEQEMYKVRGFPTCYIPPIPQTLCKYNVCGLSSCEGQTENTIHTAQCDLKCTAGNPFCEGPLYGTSRPPEINSLWSKWSEMANVTEAESPASTMKTEGKNQRSAATCINKYTGKPDLDCLGPGTGCCPEAVRNCTCITYEKNGGLVVERNIYNLKDDHKIRKRRPEVRHKLSRRPRFRYLRDIDEDIEDDDDEESNDDLDDDIVLEEDTEGTVRTTEAMENEEINEQVEKNIAEEKLKIAKNNTLSNLEATRNKGWSPVKSSIVMLILLILVMANKTFIHWF